MDGAAVNPLGFAGRAVLRLGCRVTGLEEGEAHPLYIGVDYSPDGDTILSGSDDGTPSVWNAPN